MATIEEAVRQFLLQLWNTYGFYVLYANANEVAPSPVGSQQLTDLDRWALSRLQETVAVVRERLDDFDATVSGREIQRFVDDLSNWYVRRSRRRFWDGDPAAFATLRHCLVTVSQLLAPFCPFIADEIFDNLDGSEPSVHLCDGRRHRRAMRSSSGSSRSRAGASGQSQRCTDGSSPPSTT